MVLMMKKDTQRFNIVYKTTCKLNGMYYIGKHSTINLNDGYLGSGQALTAAITKYGKDNFYREILFFCDTEEDSYLKESELVTNDVVLDRSSYNLKLGGYGAAISDDTKIKISKSLKKYFSKNRSPLKGVPISEETKSKIRKTIILKSPWKGKKHTEKSKLLMSKNRKLSNIAGFEGKEHSKETIKKMSDKKKAENHNHFDNRPVVAWNDSESIIFSSKFRGAMYLNKPRSSNITRAIKSGSKAYGYNWRYI